MTREYLWGKNMGGGIGGLLNLRQGGKDYNYLYDGKGNVTALVDVGLNTVAAAYAYDPFGVLMKKTGTIDQPYQFSTKQYDPETGLSYFGFRFYSPTLGKWMTRDPMGEGSDTNLYRFVGNNAVNWVDPFGLCDKDPKGRLICKGLAYVLAGNPRNVGQIGFPGVTVTDGSAAVIPRQFTGAMTGGPKMRAIGASTTGTVTGSKGQTQTFNGLTQPVGEKKLGTAQEAQDIIMSRAPGQLIIEIVGGKDLGPDASVTINMPDLGQGCPEGTTPAN